MTLSKHHKISKEASEKSSKGERGKWANAGAVFLIFSTAVKREDLWHPEKGYLFHATAGLLLEFAYKSNETGEM